MLSLGNIWYQQLQSYGMENQSRLGAKIAKEGNNLEINPTAIITRSNYSSCIVTQLKCTRNVRTQSIVPRDHSCRGQTIPQEYYQSNYAASMEQPTPFCKSICTGLTLLRNAQGVEMASSSLIFKVVFMIMTKGWIVPSLLNMPLYNWKNVDNRNIKKPICIYNLIFCE